MNDIVARYMRACVRAHNPRDLHAWTPDELADVFSILPPAARNLQDWAIFRDALAGGDDPSADELTPDQRESNQAFIDAVEQQKKEILDAEP